MANINDLGRLIANAVKLGLQEHGGTGSSGGVSTTGSNSVMARPTFTNLSAGINGPTPPYGAQNVVNPPFANGGSAGGRPSFGGAAAIGLGAVASQLPSVQQANFVNYANTQLAGRFAPGSQGQGPNMPGFGSNAAFTGQYNAASQFARQIAQRGTINNSMDVYAGMQQLSYRQNFGILGDANTDPFIMGASAMSNLVPGAGFEATSQSLYSAFTNPTRQNRMRMLGMSTTDSKTGRPKSPTAIVDMIWSRLNAQKMGSEPITKDDIQRSLMPGRSIDSMLNQLIGDDPLARSAVAKALIAKAISGGGKSTDELTTKENLIDMGFTTEGMVSASAKSAGEMNKVQSVARSETYGLTKANEAANILAESFARLNNLLGFANVPGVLAGLLPGKAEGGPVGASNAYMVGEMGPELFVPTSSGYIVPNEKIRLAGARHEGGPVHPHPHPKVLSSDYNSDGQLSTDKVRDILSYAGFKGESLGNAMKIVGRESGRKPGILNPDAGTGDLSYGLFQINMLGNLGPDRRKKFGLSSNEDLYDPIINAKIGYEMSNKGTSWNAWYNSANALGLLSGSGSKSGSGSGSKMESNDDTGGFLNSMKGLFPSLASGLSGIANKVGSVINYGGVKVEIVLPKGSYDGKRLVKEMKKALDDTNIQNNITTN